MQNAGRAIISCAGSRRARTSNVYRLARIGSIRRALLDRIPKVVKRRLKFLLHLTLDGVDLCLGRRKELVPPRYLNFVGGGDFEQIGEEFFRYFIGFGGLRPDDRVFEVGCGLGRMARPLTKYLVTGSYEGMDVVPHGILWCQQKIGSRYPNFHFQLADIQNQEYNPRGRLRATEYEFPFKDGEFDFVALTSVFTHMLKPDITHYLREIVRTLRCGGKCFATYFLLNDESRRLLKAGISSIDFVFPLDGCFTNDKSIPETAVGYEETHIRTLYRDLGLALETVRYGGWCGRNDFLSYQDILVARKI